MFVVDEATAAEIRRPFDQDGELAGVVEFKRHFPLISDNAKAGECVRISFPSFPGVASAAGTPEAIVGQAQDGLANAIEGMRAAGQTPPGTVEEARR